MDYVRAEAKRTWDISHARGLVAWLLRRLGVMRPAQGVWIQQFADGNWEAAHCHGEAIQTWRYDADGFTPVGDVPELDKMSAIASTTPVVKFCVDGTGERMIYQEWHGVRAGHGCVLTRRTGGDWAAEGASWKS